MKSIKLEKSVHKEENKLGDKLKDIANDFKELRNTSEDRSNKSPYRRFNNIKKRQTVKIGRNEELNEVNEMIK
jgi:hypothetical protein